MKIKKVIIFCSLLFPFLLQSQNIYKKPAMPFVYKANETILDLTFTNKSIEEVQRCIDNARGKSDVIRISLKGIFYVTKAPLKLSDKMILFLNNATIKAANNSNVSALISIEKSQFISISSTGNGTIDGSGKYIKAFEIINSGKIHIDNIKITSCKKGGVDYVGNGQKIYAEPGSITRCVIADCGEIAVSIVNSFNFIFTDNKVYNAKTGIHLDADNAVISHNTINNCMNGIEDLSHYETISYNSINKCQKGITLAASCLESFIGNNTIKENELGLELNSTKAKVYNNDCDNRNEVTGNGTKNQLFANKGITITEGNNVGCEYFNPPLLGNMHNDLIKVGKGRSDITITDVQLKEVRDLINKAHAQHSLDVIVVHLEGTFPTSSEFDSLLVNEDECILLNGTINGKGNVGKLITFSDNITASISGGTLDGNGTNGTVSMIFITGNAKAIVDSVKIINGLHQGITKRNSHAATYIRGCLVEKCGGRGYWQLAADRLFAFENRAWRCDVDGVDIDAYSTNSIIQKNYSCDNRRHGVFVEEGANGNIVLDNILDSNTTGVSFYNLEVNNNHTSRNLIASNLCRYNIRGISVSAAADNKSTQDNTIFNNTCTNSQDVGIGGYFSPTKTKNNYNAMNTIKNNRIGSFAPIASFETNYNWNTLDSVSTIPVDITQVASKVEQKAVQISWIAATESYSHHYEIERTTTMSNYKMIGKIVALSENSSGVKYTYLDKTAPGGMNFYRIKHVDNNSRITYSDIFPVENHIDTSLINIQFKKLKNWTFQVDVHSKDSIDAIALQVFDLKGNIRYKEDFNFKKALNTTLISKIPEIISGTFILYIKSSFGDVMKKVVFSRYKE